MSHLAPILLQCTRLGYGETPAIDLIIDPSCHHILECYEHEESSCLPLAEKYPKNIQELKGELLEITAIKCDPSCSSQDVVNALIQRLQECHIDIENMSLEYLQDIIWPNKSFTLRCAISQNTPEQISFLSPTNFRPAASL